MSLFSNEHVLSAGFEIDTPDSFGRTCLHAAAAGGWVAVTVAVVSYFVASLQIWCQPTWLCHPQRNLLRCKGSKAVWCQIWVTWGCLLPLPSCRGYLQSKGYDLIPSTAESWVVIWSIGFRHRVKLFLYHCEDCFSFGLGYCILTQVCLLATAVTEDQQSAGSHLFLGQSEWGRGAVAPGMLLAGELFLASTFGLCPCPKMQLCNSAHQIAKLESKCSSSPSFPFL